jgi:hypothetical protein
MIIEKNLAKEPIYYPIDSQLAIYSVYSGHTDPTIPEQGDPTIPGY